MTSSRSQRLGRWLLGAAVAPMVIAEVVVIVWAAGIDPALAGGLVLALVAAGALGLLRGEASARPGAAARAAVSTLVLGSGVLALWAAHALLVRGSTEHPLLRWLDDLVRRHEPRLLLHYCIAVVAMGLLSAGLLLARGKGRRTWRWWARLADAAALGAASAMALEYLLADGVPAWTVVLVLPCALLVARAIWPALIRAPRPTSSDPLRWPRRLLLPLLLAALVLGHAYSARIMSCPRPGEVPGLTRIAALPEVQGIALGRGGDLAVLSMPGSGCLARIALRPEPASVHVVDPGPARSWSGPHWQLNGEIGAVVYAPAVDRFFAALAWRPPDREASESQILTLSNDGMQVVSALGLPGRCPIGAIEWDADQRLLLLHCADRPGVHRLDPAAQVLRDEPGDQALAAPQRASVLLGRTKLAPGGRDGGLCLLEPDSGELLGVVAAGGQVQAIAADEARGLAYFWSRCGLFRLDLGRWLRACGRSGPDREPPR